MVTEGSDTPLIHAPDMKDDDIRNGLMCFMNDARECNPDCMAYLGFGAHSDLKGSMLSAQQSCCMLLVSAEKLVRYHGTIAKLIHDADIDKKRRNERAPTVSIPVVK